MSFYPRLIIENFLLISAGAILGAYTTFLTNTYENFDLLFKSQWLAGLLNLLGSILWGAAAASLGVFAGKVL